MFPSKVFADNYIYCGTQFGSPMRPYVLWGLILIQIVYKGYQRCKKIASFR